MLRSILLVLDDTPGALAARDQAIALARLCGGSVTGAAFLDIAHLADPDEAVPMGAAAFKEHRDAQRVAEARAAAEAQLAMFRTAAPGWPAASHDDAPEPGLKRLAAAHDLIAIGRDSTLGIEDTEDGLAPVIERLARDNPRPLLVVPPQAGAIDGPMLVAYDGSSPCQRSLQMFVQLGLTGTRGIRVVSVADTAQEARDLARGAQDYLALHGIAAEADGLSGSHPADLVLGHAAALHAGLLVIGAFETPRLRTRLFGSATLRILRESACAVFVHH